MLMINTLLRLRMLLVLVLTSLVKARLTCYDLISRLPQGFQGTRNRGHKIIGNKLKGAVSGLLASL